MTSIEATEGPAVKPDVLSWRPPEPKRGAKPVKVPAQDGPGVTAVVDSSEPLDLDELIEVLDDEAQVEGASETEASLDVADDDVAFVKDDDDEGEGPTTSPSVAPPAPEASSAGATAIEEAADKPATETPTARAERVVAYLQAKAPDAHTALLRVSLQTGIPMSALRNPERLSKDQIVEVEDSVCRILDVDTLDL